MENVLIDRRFYNEDCDYTHMLIESMYKMELISNETKFLRSLNTMVCCESSNDKALELLVEASGNSLKNFVTKLWNGIVKMWNTFVHRLEEIVGAQKKFLEDNKDIILKKTPRKVSMETYKYDLTKLQNTSIQKYDVEKIKAIKDEDSFKDTLFASMKVQISGEDAKDLSVSDTVKQWVRGSSEPITVLSTDLDFPTMYNYCYDFKNIKNKIKLELDALDSTKNDILTITTVASSNYDKEQNTNESAIINNKDIYYNKDKFDSGEINLCFITGHSGSGKTTMAKSMSDGNNNTEYYELDDVAFNKYKFTMENLKEYGDLIYDFFNTVGKKYYYTKEDVDNNIVKPVGGNYEELIINDFVDYTIKYANQHKNKKIVIEGVWIYMYLNPNKLKDYAVYIKGTSLISSTFRAIKRDSSENSKLLGKLNTALKKFIFIFTSGIDNEKQINKYRKEFKESFYYGSVLDIIKEMKVKDDNNSSSNDTNNTSQSSNKGNNQTLSNHMSNPVDGQKDPDTDKVKSDVKDMRGNGEDLDTIQEKVSIYYKLCGNVLSAKLNIASEIFKEYMQILRWHVDGFTNKEKQTKDITGKPQGQNFANTDQTVKEEKPE